MAAVQPSGLLLLPGHGVPLRKGFTMKNTEPTRGKMTSDDRKEFEVQGEAMLRLSPEPECPVVVAQAGCRVEVRATERESFTEYHVTGTVGRDKNSADELLAQVAAAVAERGIQPIQEKFYGLSGARAAVLKKREAAYRREELDLNMPVTWLQGTPLQDGEFVGLQIWGIVPHDGTNAVTTVTNPTTGVGRLWTGEGFRLLHLPSVRGLKPDGTLAGDAPAQADQMFGNAGLALKAHGMEYRNVIRTWIYMSRLLEWYDDFNCVRTAHYRPAGLGVPGGAPFPASTGIQARCADEECLMDVLALETNCAGSAVASPIIHSPRQDQSFKYGSAFSRGMALEIEGRRTVHISGTASINSAGDSIHVGNAELQSLETMLCIAAILEGQGGGLANITSSTLFCKNREAWEAWNRVSRLLQIPAFPKICVLADVCRHDLLVEMEVVATI
jgi:enamine deaminase RidA (YjgF/YER057c/UK114 family)